MSIRLSSLYGCAFVCLCLGLIQLSAKPPDLPVDETVKCRELSSGNLRYDGGVVPAGAVSGAIELDKTPGKSPYDPEICESAKPIDTITPCWNEMFRGWWDTITDWIGGDDVDTNTGIDPAGDFPLAYSRHIGADGLERIGVDFDNPQQLVQADAIGAACGASATILTTGYDAAANCKIPTNVPVYYQTPGGDVRVLYEIEERPPQRVGTIITPVGDLSLVCGNKTKSSSCGDEAACGATGKCKSDSDCCKKGKCCAEDKACASDCCKKGKCCANGKECTADCCKKGKCCADDKCCASDCCKKGKCCADDKSCASDCCKKGKCCAAECEKKAACKTGSPCCPKTKACSECADSDDCCCSTDKCKAGKACCAVATCCVAIKACPVCECPKGECTCGKGSACSNDCKCGSTAGCGVKIKCCSAKACPACECPKGECECQAGAACNAKCKCGSTGACGVKIKCCSAKACPACECPKGECECQTGAACNAKCKCGAGNSACCCVKTTGACKCAAAAAAAARKVKVLVELKPAGKTCAACACCKSCGKGVVQIIKICWKDMKYGVVESAREQAILKQAQQAKCAGQVKQAAHLYIKLAQQTCDQELVKRCKHEVLALQAERKSACPVRACCGCFGKIMGICWKDFKETMGAMARGETEVPAPPKWKPATPKVAECPTCPYLKQQQATEKAPAIKKAARECTPLDNLRALEQAEKLCDRADRLADKGKLDEAAKLYEQVKDLCPGSRFDYLATQKLREVTAQKLDQQKDPAGEEEQKTDDVPDDGGQAKGSQGCPAPACTVAEIRRRLSMPVSFDFQNVSLEEIVDEMRELSGINIVFDRRDMQEAGVDLAYLVNVKADGVTLKSALNLVLDRVKLTWTFKNDALVITTPVRHRHGMITWTYQVGEPIIPVDGIQTTSAVESAPVSKATPAVNYTCPYMKQQQAATKATTECEPAIAESALENLDKLDRARKLFGKAEQLRKKGQECQAREIYETVQQLCPGSRYDAMACERLSGLASPPATGEEQGDEQGCKTTEEDVAELLEACQRALAEGDYEKANRLAERAQELDPECVAANALVYKAHLLIQIEEKRQDAAAKHMRKVRHERKNGEPGVILIPSPCEQYIREALEKRQVELKPHMPSIDPSIVPALERVITEVEKAGWQHEAGEESEDLTPLDCDDEEYPGCVDQSDDPHADASAACVRAGSAKVLDTLRQAVGADVDVDCSRGVRCQVNIGGVTCRLENGPVKFVVVSWSEGDDEQDLHAQQRAHQEQVIEWIEQVSSGESVESRVRDCWGIPVSVPVQEVEAYPLD